MKSIKNFLLILVIVSFVCISPNKILAEETDAEVKVVVTDSIDLIASGSTPNVAIVNQGTDFYSTISNIGGMATDWSFYVLWKVASSSSGSGTITTAKVINPIMNGESSYTSSYRHIFTTSGVYSVQVCADSDSAVSESNENNNCSDWVDITVYPTLTASISANPSTITLGNSSSLTWNSTGTTSCSVTGPNVSASGTSNTIGVSTGTIPSTTSYILNCTGPAGTVSDSVVVYVIQPPTVSVTASPSTVSYNDGTSTISWSSTGATSCNSGGHGTGTTGSFNTGKLTSNTTYTVSCTGTGGTSSGSATVTVGAPQAVSVSVWADSSNVDYGGSTYINWSSSNATSCADINGNNLGATSGRFNSGSLYYDSTFYVYCNGPAGTTSGSTTVYVSPDPNSLMGGDLVPSSYSCNISSGYSICSIPFSWTTTNPVGVSAITKDGYGTIATGNNGSNQYFNITYGTNVFYLYNNGELLDSEVVYGYTASDCDWNGSYCESNLPTASLTANPSNIKKGGVSYLSWDSSNTTSCLGVAFETDGSTSGSFPVSPVETVTYTLNCSGPRGNTSVEATVNVDDSAINPTYKEF